MIMYAEVMQNCIFYTEHCISFFLFFLRLYRVCCIHVGNVILSTDNFHRSYIGDILHDL